MGKNKIYFAVEANENTLNEKIMEEYKKRDLDPQKDTYNVEGVNSSDLKLYFICVTKGD